MLTPPPIVQQPLEPRPDVATKAVAIGGAALALVLLVVLIVVLSKSRSTTTTGPVVADPTSLTTTSNISTTTTKAVPAGTATLAQIAPATTGGTVQLTVAYAGDSSKVTQTVALLNDVPQATQTGLVAQLTMPAPAAGSYQVKIQLVLSEGTPIVTAAQTLIVTAATTEATPAPTTVTTPAPTTRPTTTSSGISYRVNPNESLPIHTGTNQHDTILANVPRGDYINVRCWQRGEALPGPYYHNGADPDPYWLYSEWHGTTGWVTDQYVVTRSDIDNGVIPAC